MPRSAARSKEALDKLVDGDAVAMDLLPQLEAAFQAVTPRDDDALLCRRTQNHCQVRKKLYVSEDALQSARGHLAHRKPMHNDATICRQI